MTDALQTLFRGLKGIGVRLIRPLQRSDGPNKFRLSAVDTATTTHDGDQGWGKRPPATLECDRCGGEVFQPNARDDIDCPHCVAEYDYEEFGELELVHMTCPVCKSTMSHGQRHPERFDVVEWATCDGCRYHWEFKHSYS